jgi:hypothetical protein
MAAALATEILGTILANKSLPEPLRISFRSRAKHGRWTEAVPVW